jgi:outer membrane autotransporter protein
MEEIMSRALMYPFLLFLLLVFILPPASAADNTGFYTAVTACGGELQADDAHLDYSGTLQGSLSFADRDDTYWGAGLGLGYDFRNRASLPFRLELEYLYRSQTEARWSGDEAIFIDAPFDWKFDADFQVQTAFLNLAWDIHTSLPVTPYLQAGIGAAFHESEVSYQDEDGNKVKVDETNTELAWNIGAGLAYALNSHWSVDLGYRYLDAGTAELKSGTIRGIIWNPQADISLHEGVLRIRYTF